MSWQCSCGQRNSDVRAQCRACRSARVSDEDERAIAQYEMDDDDAQDDAQNEKGFWRSLNPRKSMRRATRANVNSGNSGALDDQRDEVEEPLHPWGNGQSNDANRSRRFGRREEETDDGTQYNDMLAFADGYSSTPQGTPDPSLWPADGLSDAVADDDIDDEDVWSFAGGGGWAPPNEDNPWVDGIDWESQLPEETTASLGPVTPTEESLAPSSATPLPDDANWWEGDQDYIGEPEWSESPMYDEEIFASATASPVEDVFAPVERQPELVDDLDQLRELVSSEPSEEIEAREEIEEFEEEVRPRRRWSFGLDDETPVGFDEGFVPDDSPTEHTNVVAEEPSGTPTKKPIDNPYAQVLGEDRYGLLDGLFDEPEPEPEPERAEAVVAESSPLDDEDDEPVQIRWEPRSSRRRHEDQHVEEDLDEVPERVVERSHDERTDRDDVDAEDERVVVSEMELDYVESPELDGPMWPEFDRRLTDRRTGGRRDSADVEHIDEELARAEVVPDDFDWSSVPGFETSQSFSTHMQVDANNTSDFRDEASGQDVSRDAMLSTEDNAWDVDDPWSDDVESGSETPDAIPVVPRGYIGLPPIESDEPTPEMASQDEQLPTAQTPPTTPPTAPSTTPPTAPLTTPPVAEAGSGLYDPGTFRQEDPEIAEWINAFSEKVAREVVEDDNNNQTTSSTEWDMLRDSLARERGEVPSELPHPSVSNRGPEDGLPHAYLVQPVPPDLPEDELDFDTEGNAQTPPPLPAQAPEPPKDPVEPLPASTRMNWSIEEQRGEEDPWWETSPHQDPQAIGPTNANEVPWWETPQPDSDVAPNTSMPQQEYFDHDWANWANTSSPQYPTGSEPQSSAPSHQLQSPPYAPEEAPPFGVDDFRVGQWNRPVPPQPTDATHDGSVVQPPTPTNGLGHEAPKSSDATEEYQFSTHDFWNDHPENWPVAGSFHPDAPDSPFAPGESLGPSDVAPNDWLGAPGPEMPGATTGFDEWWNNTPDRAEPPLSSPEPTPAPQPQPQRPNAEPNQQTYPTANAAHDPHIIERYAQSQYGPNAYVVDTYDNQDNEQGSPFTEWQQRPPRDPQRRSEREQQPARSDRYDDYGEYDEYDEYGPGDVDDSRDDDDSGDPYGVSRRGPTKHRKNRGRDRDRTQGRERDDDRAYRRGGKSRYTSDDYGDGYYNDGSYDDYDDEDDWGFDDDDDDVAVRGPRRGASSHRGRPSSRDRSTRSGRSRRGSSDDEGSQNPMSSLNPLVIVGIVVAVLLIVFALKGAFSQANASEAPGNVVTCAGVNAPQDLKLVSDLAPMMMSAPQGWTRQTDFAARTGPIDHTRALKLELDSATALSQLDRSRFVSGFDRQFSVDSDLVLNVAIRQFPTSACAGTYVSIQPATDLPGAISEVRGIGDEQKSAYVSRSVEGKNVSVVHIVKGNFVVSAKWDGGLRGRTPSAIITALRTQAEQIPPKVA